MLGVSIGVVRVYKWSRFCFEGLGRFFGGSDSWV